MKQHDLNHGRHIDDIISRTTCPRHRAGIDVACFYVYSSINGEPGPAICNSRIKKAGFNGEISPGSLRQKSREGSAYSRR